RYWIENEPDFGEQAVFLDDRVYQDDAFRPTRADFDNLKRQGINIVAPPMWALLDLNADGEIVASAYAKLAMAAGLDIITWTFERSDLRKGARDGSGKSTWHYQTAGAAIDKDSAMYEALHVLARDVKIRGIFSDWPATVTYYANCMGLK
ncbi:MAG: glycerophosphodiester phosphodiesterase, partial [Gammaproteobacteria bacterium]|nr:glycerophosphodiester phosphodiesterase [Gammaproteobacteria bacterium]